MMSSIELPDEEAPRTRVDAERFAQLLDPDEVSKILAESRNEVMAHLASTRNEREHFVELKGALSRAGSGRIATVLACLTILFSVYRFKLVLDDFIEPVADSLRFIALLKWASDFQVTALLLTILSGFAAFLLLTVTFKIFNTNSFGNATFKGALVGVLFCSWLIYFGDAMDLRSLSNNGRDQNLLQFARAKDLATVIAMEAFSRNNFEQFCEYKPPEQIHGILNITLCRDDRAEFLLETQDKSLGVIYAILYRDKADFGWGRTRRGPENKWQAVPGTAVAVNEEGLRLRDSNGVVTQYGVSRLAAAQLPKVGDKILVELSRDQKTVELVHRIAEK